MKEIKDLVKAIKIKEQKIEKQRSLIKVKAVRKQKVQATSLIEKRNDYIKFVHDSIKDPKLLSLIYVNSIEIEKKIRIEADISSAMVFALSIFKDGKPKSIEEIIANMSPFGFNFETNRLFQTMSYRGLITKIDDKFHYISPKGKVVLKILNKEMRKMLKSYVFYKRNPVIFEEKEKTKKVIKGWDLSNRKKRIYSDEEKEKLSNNYIELMQPYYDMGKGITKLPRLGVQRIKDYEEWIANKEALGEVVNERYYRLLEEWKKKLHNKYANQWKKAKKAKMVKKIKQKIEQSK